MSVSPTTIIIALLLGLWGSSILWGAASGTFKVLTTKHWPIVTVEWSGDRFPGRSATRTVHHRDRAPTYYEFKSSGRPRIAIAVQDEARHVAVDPPFLGMPDGPFSVAYDPDATTVARIAGKTAAVDLIIRLVSGLLLLSIAGFMIRREFRNSESPGEYVRP